MLVGLAKDHNVGWWKQFEAALIERQIPYKLLDLEPADWMDYVKECDAVIYRFNYEQPSWRQALEKLYIIEFVLKKKVFPEMNSRWHYNNKLAQAYLASLYRLKLPPTFVSYSFEDTVSYLKKAVYPLVSKSSGGASSENVRLISSFTRGNEEAESVFGQNNVLTFFDKILNKLHLVRKFRQEQDMYVAYQKFIPGNDRDYRVTTIGRDRAFAFHRKNRPGDFRASGSGLIEYGGTHDREAIKYCIEVSRLLGFSSMSYDIVYDETDFYMLEFSYTYTDLAIYNAPGHFQLNNGALDWIEGHQWPQHLIVDYLMDIWTSSILGLYRTQLYHFAYSIHLINVFVYTNGMVFQ